MIYTYPVIARNSLVMGKSENLWYEQIVPRQSIFYTLISSSRPRTELLRTLLMILGMWKTVCIQIGANASIGYGFCKVESVPLLKLHTVMKKRITDFLIPKGNRGDKSYPNCRRQQCPYPLSRVIFPLLELRLFSLAYFLQLSFLKMQMLLRERGVKRKSPHALKLMMDQRSWRQLGTPVMIPTKN